MSVHALRCEVGCDEGCAYLSRSAHAPQASILGHSWFVRSIGVAERRSQCLTDLAGGMIVLVCCVMLELGSGMVEAGAKLGCSAESKQTWWDMIGR